ncbi:hypothetical protein [Oenococcus sicerae]|uniref:hypothetical protein n=1 Tax=Oenococcus sicerae TaxID=2203724 RepID=UPI0026582CC3|nr:hypothetical protein [Oenococcus sicerae]
MKLFKRENLSDLLSVVGLAVIDVTAFLFQPFIGGVTTGLSLILLSYFLGKE